MSAGAYEQAGQPRVLSTDGQLIGDLPPELFVEVLADVCLLHRRASGLKWDTNWTMPYQLVCRRWRDVICSTPQFWQEISVRSSPRWLELCLARCAGAPATIVVWHPTWPDATFATLCRYASSVGACLVHSDFPDVSSLSGLSSLLAAPVPALETLSIDGLVGNQARVAIPITHDTVPHLTSLNLRGCIAPCDAEVYVSLRSLTLLRSTCTTRYGEFLGMIGKCHRLEHLNLDEDIFDSFVDQVACLALDYPTLVTPAVLPRLKSLKLSGRCDVLFHFLANIHTPQARRIELANCLDDDESGPIFTRLLAPGLHLRVPFLSSPRTVSLNCWVGAPFKLCLRGGGPGPDRHALLSVDYGMVHNEFWPGNADLEPNLVAVMDSFSVASVDTLEIEGYLDEVAVETWQRVFGAFSGLHTLHVKGRGTFHALWLGLRRADVRSLERDGMVCCPLLTEVAIDDCPRVASRFKFTATTELLEIVPETLRARFRDAGGSRFKKLQLYLKYSDEMWRKTSGLRKAFVGDVRALVEELDYREWRA